MFFANVASAVVSISGAPYFAGHQTASIADYTYFSFITLATVGYGAFAAIQRLGRALVDLVDLDRRAVAHVAPDHCRVHPLHNQLRDVRVPERVWMDGPPQGIAAEPPYQLLHARLTERYVDARPWIPACRDPQPIRASINGS
jgi:hypothetical protein